MSKPLFFGIQFLDRFPPLLWKFFEKDKVQQQALHKNSLPHHFLTYPPRGGEREGGGFRRFAREITNIFYARKTLWNIYMNLCLLRGGTIFRLQETISRVIEEILKISNARTLSDSQE
ncbi:hypothetical protein CDAR_527921 [Caerostris darwini]|uniref:Uncharacterized protein n=1 Tax=Caerostris darwini TaxID=1538125 RepID=A0AAV4QWJ0_9ARAC|nr:hypothetical protein CDAR_527921 [Caerostris darwini]